MCFCVGAFCLLTGRHRRNRLCSQWSLTYGNNVWIWFCQCLGEISTRNAPRKLHKNQRELGNIVECWHCTCDTSQQYYSEGETACCIHKNRFTLNFVFLTLLCFLLDKGFSRLSTGWESPFLPWSAIPLGNLLAKRVNNPKSLHCVFCSNSFKVGLSCVLPLCRWQPKKLFKWVLTQPAAQEHLHPWY